MTELTLNTAQTRAYINLKKYLQHQEKNKFLLLGPAGSGKTTVIVNSFNNSQYKIAFCAFTNKATQVLKKIADRFAIQFQADFLTIHKLLRLEIKFFDKETEIGFTFDKNKLDHLKNYDIIIFDECSTISKELFRYICEAQEYIKFKHDIDLKYIFLGDFWQLAPVGEDLSIVFNTAIHEQWLTSKLECVERSTNKKIKSINDELLLYVNKFRENNVNDFANKYPFNLVPKNSEIYLHFNNFLDKFIQTWKEVSSDTIILTYSTANCIKTNNAIQDLIDASAGRDIPQKRENIYFYIGDRCCIDRPIDLWSIKTHKLLDESKEDTSLLGNLPIMSLDRPLNESLFNGEIFDVINTEDVLVTTHLNKLKYMPKYFKAQLLTISRINDYSAQYQIFHISEKDINAARKTIRSNERKMYYLTVMSDFINKYPKLDYGYCITIYKSQGSEWNTVFINLNSIKWSITGKSVNVDFDKKIQLFKTTYTALSRASDNIYLFWSQ